MKKVFSICMKTSSLLFFMLFCQNGLNSVEAATTLPDNHTIEQLEVKWLNDGKSGHSIDVGNRKGTLLIRIDQPKVERNVEWVNWAITNVKAVGFQMYPTLDTSKHVGSSAFGFTGYPDGYAIDEGYPDKWAKEDGRLKFGLIKFSDFRDPNYYAGLAIYLDKPYSNDGKYWFGGMTYALKEPGQIKAYFFPNQDLVLDAYDRTKTGGTFPLMNKVMWGKTELWKGQLGKVTIKKPVTLWKRLDNGKLEKVRDLNQGDEFRVYRYLGEEELYGVGSGMYVKNIPSEIIYETPSKKNLRLIRIMNGEE
ncbi:MAG: hypothetical protein WAM41_15500 [Psychrobacillus psychrotolerans]|uniref:hypothetical protein n=1 Tax=Psychrobacillus psychrotolerans TaxID=126156 RepID=UPI003BAE1EF6